MANDIADVDTEDANIRKPYFSLDDFIIHSGMSIVAPFRATQDCVAMWANNKDKVYDKRVPKHGELCWFYNSDSTIPFLSLFIHKHHTNYYSISECDGYDAWQYCEPFVSTLPNKFIDLQRK